VYFKDFPIEQIHPWAKAGGDSGAMPFSGRIRQPSGQFHDWIYEHQAEITPDNLKTKVLEFAQNRQRSGWDAVGTLYRQQGDRKRTWTPPSLKADRSRLTPPPLMFVNGRRLIGNYPWKNLQQLINGELNYQKTAQNAGREVLRA